MDIYGAGVDGAAGS